MLTAAEIKRHCTRDSCWLVVGDRAYDVTSYLGEHPGGAAILLQQGGKDATAEFRKVHSPDVLQYLPRDSCVGRVDAAVLANLPVSGPAASSSSSSSSGDGGGGGAAGLPHIAECVAVGDFEAAARAVLPARSFSYVSSSAGSGQSHAGNLDAWARVVFRPRILSDVRAISTRTSILGCPSALPFYVSPMGQMGRVHPDGEIALVRALARRGVHGLMSTESTQPVEDVMAAFNEEMKKTPQPGPVAAGVDGQPPPPAQLHFQLYVPADRESAIERIRRARALGFRSLWVTVDTPWLGKRTRDRRQQASEALAAGLEPEAESAGFGLRAHAAASQFCPGLTWADLRWIREAWGRDRPLALKGVQCWEDVARAALDPDLAGLVDAVLLSNHGGRQAHAAPSALATLCEVRARCPSALQRVKVFVDGGCRDGADVLKALCLGAAGVGIGRPLFYALAAYGTKGVERCIDLLTEELLMGMRLTGMNTLADAQPDRVNARRLQNDMWLPEGGGLQKSRL